MICFSGGMWEWGIQGNRGKGEGIDHIAEISVIWFFYIIISNSG